MNLRDRFIEREDGSVFDREQLRDGGKFIKQRVWLTLPDIKALERNGYSLVEAHAACRELNIELDRRIQKGESERELMAELAKFV